MHSKVEYDSEQMDFQNTSLSFIKFAYGGINFVKESTSKEVLLIEIVILRRQNTRRALLASSMFVLLTIQQNRSKRKVFGV